MEEEKDKKSRNVGLIATITFHGAIALIFLMLMAWKAPNPPLAEYGVEINLGFQDEGSGEEQIATDPGNEGTMNESAQQPTEAQPEEVKEESTQEQSQEQVVTEDQNPVTVKEEKKKEEVKTEPKKEEVKKTTPTETKKEEVKTEALFDPTKTTDKTTSQKTGENKSEGDDTNKTGNKGQPTGTLDPNAKYSGIQGGGAGGNGTGLDLAGWKWDSTPAPEIPENESGRLVFEIWVDGDGEITRLVPIERGLSAAAEKICRDEIMKLTFTPTGANVPEISKGKITFIVTRGK